MAQTASAKGVSPQEFVDGIATHFQAMWARLGISYDQFIRTTDPAHKAGVRALIKRIHEASPDDYYEKSYEGWYCVGCELFKRDNEIVEGKCVLHPTRGAGPHDRCFVGEVEMDAGDIMACLVQRCRDPLRALIVTIGNDHPGAGLRQRRDNADTDAACTPGDQCHLSIEAE